MPKVICTRPNASDLISGVKFEKHELGMISEEIDDEQAERFLSIGGYELESSGKKAPAATPDEDKDELAALQARAEALGVNVNSRWKAERLNAEISKAEEAAAEAAKASGGDDTNQDNPEA